jgi:threonine dehydrogenase-like Zn-dependent dehydrogenase
VDILDKKLEKAKEFGAVATINPTKVEKLPKEIRKLTGGGADVAFEVIGKPETINEAFNCIRVGGRLVVVGYTAKEVPIRAAKIMFQELEVVGSLGCRPLDYPKCVELVRLGKIKIKELVTSRFKLEEIESALDLLKKGDPDTIRSIIVP